ncbi:MAG: transporter substrate-binding domain-containing protein, partial [Burkholderiaceae bacterium]
MNRRDVIGWIGSGLAGPKPAVGLVSGLACAAGAAAADPLLTSEEQSWVAKHPVVLYAPEIDFPPFSFVDDQGRHLGLSADVLDLVQSHTGLKFQAAAAADAASNLDRLRRREVDLLTSLRPTAEREAFASFTSAYVSSPSVILRRRGDRRPGDLQGMAGEFLAVDRHSAAETFVRETAPGVHLVQVDIAADGLRDLAFGEFDAATVNLATASYIIERDRLSGIRVAGETGYFSTLAIGYRKDWPMLGRVLEKGLARITEAERSEMIARWIPLSDIDWWQRPEVERVLGAASIGTGLLMGGLLLWNRALRRAVAQRTDALQEELAERQRLETRLRMLAEHDALTGLMNRTALTEALRHSLALAMRQKWAIAVIFIDLDRFK